MDIDPQYPDVGKAARKDLLVTKRDLEREAPAGAPADPYADRHPSARKERG
jgi:hypothetical protein